MLPILNTRLERIGTMGAVELTMLCEFCGAPAFAIECGVSYCKTCLERELEYEDMRKVDDGSAN